MKFYIQEVWLTESCFPFWTDFFQLFSNLPNWLLLDTTIANEFMYIAQWSRCQLITIFLSVDQWVNSGTHKQMNKGTKIGEKSAANYLQCCERCQLVAPLTNAGHFATGNGGSPKTCHCFLVTGKYFPLCLNYKTRPNGPDRSASRSLIHFLIHLQSRRKRGRNRRKTF